MDITGRAAAGAGRGGWASARLLPAAVPALFAATLLLAAFLLFSLQPMFGKLVLPVLGGTPAVWSVAMVFFQGLLLAGYAYAHLSSRWLPLRAAAALHAALLLSGLCALPVGLAAGVGVPPADGEALWLAGLFLASVGLPFFAVSATAPLLQAWFAASGHPAAADPYALYRASNLGSFGALIAYPLLIEPVLGLAEQSRLWSVGYALLACAIGTCALAVLREPGRRVSLPPEVAPTLARRAGWVFRSAVPAGLLVAVTAHITTDIAAIPLMWVLPLAFYLLTFVVTFRPYAAWPARPLAALQVGGTAMALGAAVLGDFPLAGDLALSLGVFVVASLNAHRALYADRPGPARLTAFYLYTSLGGTLGGLFAALLAPRLFAGIAEYPLLLTAALACRPGLVGGFGNGLGKAARAGLGGLGADLRRLALPAGAALAAVSATWLATGPSLAIKAAAAILMAWLLLSWRAPRAALVGAGLLCALALARLPLLAHDFESRRSFFGVHLIQTTADGRFRLLAHGRTLHGAFRLRDDDGRPAAGRPEPTTYYAPGGALADTLEVARRAHGALPAVAVVGLGAGSLACHARAGEAWTFYEIDPAVIRIARDTALFRFLSACTPDAAIVQGDARLMLARTDAAYRVLLVDAFSSDAIPLHLLTGEALALYRARLDKDGLLALHISNRHFDLAPALARLAAEQGLKLLVRRDRPSEPMERRWRSPAVLAILTRDPAVEREAEALGWRALAPDMRRRPWTDDYANPLEALADGWAASGG